MDRKAKIKRLKKIIIVNIASLSLVSAMLLVSLGVEKFNKTNNEDVVTFTKENVVSEKIKSDNKHKNRNLDELRKVKLETYVNTYKDEDGVRREYNFANEEDILQISKELSVAIEQHFKSCGAGNWTNGDLNQFWPEDIAYMITAIAYRESTYRTNIINNIGCGGLTGLQKESLLDTLSNQWLVPRIWGDSVPQVNCNPKEVDIFNPTTCIEYTYYNIGYNLANRFKKDKYFTDIDGERRSIWQVLDYSEETQNRLIIASHLFGVNNITNAVFNRPNSKGKVVAIEEYLHCDYVEDVLDKMHELKNTYENNFER